MFRLPGPGGEYHRVASAHVMPHYDLASLLAGSVVWMLWSVLSVILLDTGYPFSISQLFSLIATAGLSGACLRLTALYLIDRSGAKRPALVALLFLALTLVLLLFALADPDTPFWVFRLAALFSGFGALLLPIGILPDNSISPALNMTREIRTGMADSGLTIVQVLVPLLGIVGAFPEQMWGVLTLANSSSYILGKVDAGGHFAVLPALLIPVVILLLAFANVLPARTQNLTGKAPKMWQIVLPLMLVTILCAGLTGLFSGRVDSAVAAVPGEVVIVLAVFLTLGILRLLPGSGNSGFQQVIANREIQLTALMYLMGFGSFLGFAASLPLLGKVVFDIQPASSGSYQSSPLDSGVLMYVWLLPMTGLLARGIGGWVSTYMKPEKVNQLALLMMFASSLLMAHFLRENMSSGLYYRQFYASVMLFFIGAGLSSGSVFHLLVRVFPPAYARQARVWIVAVSTFGVFYIANIFATHHGSVDPSSTITGFAIFYMTGMMINWYFFLRRSSEMSF